ncbi:MAG: S-adenosyl-l-methionine hydroxide adenosyltransferase family protein [Methanocellales archaeon]|nr:S-adenosyl-l-methionine hydroxide adenosyltransferase family protein [Methanocellales archaeon]
MDERRIGVIMPIITLLTDFGDLYPALMKAVILKINPDAHIIDISHNIPPQNIRAGAFALMYATEEFPGRTIHVAVIDPGVGTERRALVIKAGEQYLVGPDNGLLIPAARNLGDFTVYKIRVISPKSATFHGRDVFAPVAARLSKDYDTSKFKSIDDFVNLDFGKTRVSKGALDGEVVYIDAFGNVITNIPGSLALQHMHYGDEVEVCGQRMPFVRTYAEASGPLITIGSHRFLEISVRGGVAARLLKLRISDLVRIRLKR